MVVLHIKVQNLRMRLWVVLEFQESCISSTVVQTTILMFRNVSNLTMSEKATASCIPRPTVFWSSWDICKASRSVHPGLTKCARPIAKHSWLPGLWTFMRYALLLLMIAWDYQVSFSDPLHLGVDVLFVLRARGSYQLWWKHLIEQVVPAGL